MKIDKISKKEIIKFVIELVVIACVTTYIFKNVVVPVKVDGESMYPTLHDADTGLINTTNINEKAIKRFDIVVLYSSQLDKQIVKRVIGLPGDTIEYRNDRLYVNGIYYEEKFLDTEFMKEAKESYNSTQFTKNFTVTVGNDSIFVMGDNRLNSRDSRTLGSFSYEDIIGKRGIILFPLKSMQWIE